MSAKDNFLSKRNEFAKSVGVENLYDYIDNFSLFAGQHTIGNKFFTYELLKATSKIPSDIAEFGCWKGSNLMFLAKLKRLLEPDFPKRIIGFDNFSGLPDPMPVDGDYAKTQVGQYCGNETVLRKAISLFEFEDLVELVPGDALVTIPEFKSKNNHLILSFAYLDFDLYEPTKTALDLIGDCLSVGGIIVFDNACTREWPGETLAMKEFLARTKNRYKMISNTLSKQPTVALKRVV